MSPASHAGRKRSERTGRRALVAMGAAAMMLPLMAGGASAQTFLDPADPCIGDPPPADFSDREQIAEVHRLNVDCAAFEEIALGKEDGRYAPVELVTRAQMASFVIRTLEAGGFEIPAPEDNGFEDIEGNEHEDTINQMATLNITEGVTATQYDPELPVLRDQMASFVTRAANVAYENDMLAGNTTGPFPFTDVSEGNVHRESIAASNELLGVSQGTTATTYDPRAGTSRQQMATFLIRLLDVTLIPELSVTDPVLPVPVPVQLLPLELP